MRIAAISLVACLCLAAVAASADALAATAPEAAAPEAAASAVTPDARANLVTLVETGNRTKAIELIKSHTDVRARDVDGTTALHWAAHQSDVELAQLLIAAGADVKAVNDYGASPMSAAAENGDAGM